MLSALDLARRLTAGAPTPVAHSRGVRFHSRDSESAEKPSTASKARSAVMPRVAAVL